MDIGEIVKDAVRYPLSDWKKILILGIIIVFTGIASNAVDVGLTNMDVISFLVGIGFIIGFLVNGYMFRIIKSSLDGKVKLPEFNDWVNMGADGVKVFISFIVYSIPAILIIIILTVLSFESYIYFALSLESAGLNPLGLLFNPFLSVIWQGITNLVIFLCYLSLFAPDGIIWILIGIVYMIIIIPLFLVAIANMAYYDGEFRSAFRFREILEEIASIGWGNLIKWYVVTGILFLILIVIANVIAYALSLIHPILGRVLLSLILFSYIYMYIARSVALFYMPD